MSYHITFEAESRKSPPQWSSSPTKKPLFKGCEKSNSIQFWQIWIFSRKLYVHQSSVVSPNDLLWSLEDPLHNTPLADDVAVPRLLPSRASQMMARSSLAM